MSTAFARNSAEDKVPAEWFILTQRPVARGYAEKAEPQVLVTRELVELITKTVSMMMAAAIIMR